MHVFGSAQLPILISLLSIAHCLAWSQSDVVLSKSGLGVETSSGKAIGHPAPGFSDVAEYLGIPFAEPPVHALRFAPPKVYRSNRMFQANSQPRSCIQQPTSVNSSWPAGFRHLKQSGVSFTANTSEDCLYLNVWTKHPNKVDQKKPVLVWFYGGGFTGGGASDSAEQGPLWTHEQDIVMVNFNYRLGIFGFSGAPGLSPNVGLLDQRLAIEWVRDNIAKFGGDPEKIVIFGHSAGGASVDIYNYVWLNDPIIAGSIPMSGTATSFGRRNMSTAAEAFYNTSKLLDCGTESTASPAKVLDCVRQKSAGDVFNASLKAGKTVASSLSRIDQIYAGVTGIYGPTVDNKLVFENYTTRVALGKLIRKPIVTGSNDDEACFFTEEGEIPEKADTLITQIVFTCPVEYAALYRAKNTVTTWKYRYYGSYPNVELNACPGKPWHGQEVYVMFGYTATLSEEKATKRELDMGKYFRTAFSSFANDPQCGLSNISWPQFDNHQSEVAALGKNSSIMTVESASRLDKTCFSKFQNGGPVF